MCSIHPLSPETRIISGNASHDIVNARIAHRRLRMSQVLPTQGRTLSRRRRLPVGLRNSRGVLGFDAVGMCNDALNNLLLLGGEIGDKRLVERQLFMLQFWQNVSICWQITTFQ